MDKYQFDSVSDFLQDEQFIDWVKTPTPEMTTAWEEWMSNNPEKVPLLLQAKEIILAFDFETEPVPDAYYTNLKTRIDRTIAGTRQQPAKVIRLIPSWLRVAATVVGAIVTGTVIYWSLSSNQLTTVSSRYAETRVIHLPDQSEVVLNANSTLKYPARWSNENREVWIDGEGYFTIRHIEQKPNQPLPFVVHSGKVNIEVLGTRFNVRDRDSSTQVLLTHGKVKITLQQDKQQLMLTPNDLVTYHHQTGKLMARRVNPGAYIAWMEHKFIFNRLSLQEICNNVQHYFGTSFMINDPRMALQELSGTLELHSQDTLVQTLSVLLGTTVKKINNQVIIYAK